MDIPRVGRYILYIRWPPLLLYECTIETIYIYCGGEPHGTVVCVCAVLSTLYTYYYYYKLVLSRVRPRCIGTCVVPLVPIVWYVEICHSRYCKIRPCHTRHRLLGPRVYTQVHNTTLHYITYNFTLRDNDTRVRKKIGVNVHNTILAHEITIFFETKTDALRYML